MKSFRKLTGTAIGTALLLGAATSPAATVFGLTESGHLVNFDSAAPNAALTVGLVSGMGTGEALIGMDFRPADGVLYGVSDSNNLYSLNTATAQATLVGALDTELGSSRFGFDFNPVPDRLRINGDGDQNLRCNPGALSCIVDGALAYDGADPNSGRNPNVVGAAYTNNVAGASTTTLYGIDSTLNALVLQNPPNNGTLTTVGTLGVNTTDLVGFDILTIGAINTAYASLTQTGSFLSRLYTIDLTTGLASPVGGTDFTSLIGAGDQLRALAVAGSTAVPGPASFWLLLTGLGALRYGRKWLGTK